MKKYVINLRNRISETDVIIRSLPIHQYVSAKNKLFLISGVLPTKIIKFCKPIRHIFVLDSSANALRTIFDKCKFILQLSSFNDSVHSDKNIYSINNQLFLENNTLSAIRLLLEKGKNTLLFNAVNGLVSKTSYSSFYHKMRIDSKIEGYNRAIKFSNFVHNLSIIHDVNPTSQKNTSLTTNVIDIGSTVSRVYMTKYRTLGEMDYDNGIALTISNFDNISLEDIDYIII